MVLKISKQFIQIIKILKSVDNLFDKMKQKALQVKVVMVGDVAVGKSSITVQYVHNIFDDKMQSTLGAAYLQKIQQFSGKPIKIKIWDTAGQQKYKSIARLYYKDAQIAVIIYDVTRRQTFLNLKGWAQQLKKHAPKNIIFVVVANKIDLLQSKKEEIQQSQITKKQEGKQFAQSINASFYQVSAKQKEAIQQLFNQSVQSAIPIIQKSTLSTHQSNFKSSSKLSKSSIMGDQNSRQRRKCCQN